MSTIGIRSSFPAAAVATLLLALPYAAVPATAQVFVDDFNDGYINPQIWTASVYGSGVEIGEEDQRLEFGFLPDGTGSEFGARLVSVFRMRGDFAVRVDFMLLDWPRYNGVRTAIALTDSYYDDYGMERSSLSSTEPLGEHEVYIADFGPFVLVPTEDQTGSLRLVRDGATQTGYFYSAGQWVPVLTDYAPTGDISIQLHAWSHDYAFKHWNVRAAFDNFTVEYGELVDLPVPTNQTSWGAIKRLYGNR